MVQKIVSHPASVVAQNKKHSSQKRGGPLKVSNIFYQPAFQAASPAERLADRMWPTFETFQAASPTFLLHDWRGSQEQCKVIVIKVILHTFRKAITDHYLATGMFLPLHRKSWNKEISFRYCRSYF